MLAVFCSSLTFIVGAQNDEVFLELDKKNSYTIDEIFDRFESKYQLVFSYSPDVIDVSQVLDIRDDDLQLLDFLKKIEKSQSILFSTATYPRILLFRKTEEGRAEDLVKARRYGYVMDELTKEKLIGALILDEEGDLLGITDQNGFYSTVVNIESSMLFSYIGYDTKIVIPKENQERFDIFLKTGNQLKTVLITTSNPKEVILVEGQQGLIDIDKLRNTVGFLGEVNAMQVLRKKAGIQSGAEGQTGLYVRGGSPDQNLLLYNGIPIYEMSHVAGVSSILQADDLQSIELYKNGIPARFGGRLSSVVNIQSKNGNKTHYEANVGLSLSAINAHIDGPLIKDKVSYNINARQSTLGIYLEPIANTSLDYEDLGVNYYDFSTHIHAQLSPNDQLNIFGYKGGDRISFDTSISSENDDSQFLFTDRNIISWSTELLGITYEKVLSENILAQFNASMSKYDISSRGSYTSDRITSGGSARSELEIISSTDIEDRNLGLNIDYFTMGSDKISIGYQYQSHQYRPALLQSALIVEDELRERLGDQEPIPTTEQALYIEYRGRSLSWLNWNIGLRRSWFSTEGVNYKNWEPRVSLKTSLTKHLTLRGSYNRTAQYVHMLTNPGSGFPADLWVPSTAAIPAQTVNHYSLNVELKNLLLDRISLGYFAKNYDGLIEYTGENDIFYSIINESDPIIFFENKTDWQSRLELGNGSARGIELSLDHKIKRLSLIWNLTLSSSTRNFENLNDGEDFPYRYDRPVDHFISAGYQLNDHWSAKAEFSYGSGAAYSLALEQFLTPEGDTIRISDGRNKQRLPAFHHLDLYVTYTKAKPKGILSIQVGVYNVYNRLNPFYVYQYNDSVQNQLRLRQVSLFPILPSININWKFKPQKYRRSRLE